MRILIATLFALLFFASSFLANASNNSRQPALKGLDFKRLNAEMEYLSQKAFLGEEEKKQDLRASYFDRQPLAEEAAQETLPETVIDLDQVYFSDSVSTKAAGAQRK